MDTRITALRELPSRLRSAVDGLNDKQLDTTYREGGWTVRQVVHHLADSHLNAFIRAKLILTEDHPTLKPYDQDLWAMLEDAKGYAIESSLSIIDGVQARMAALFEAATPAQLARTAHHPEDGELSLEAILEKYARHGEGHLYQITELRSRMGW